EPRGARVLEETDVLVAESRSGQAEHQPLADEVFKVGHVVIVRPSQARLAFGCGSHGHVTGSPRLRLRLARPRHRLASPSAAARTATSQARLAFGCGSHGHVTGSPRLRLRLARPRHSA